MAVVYEMEMTKGTYWYRSPDKGHSIRICEPRGDSRGVSAADPSSMVCCAKKCSVTYPNVPCVTLEVGNHVLRPNRITNANTYTDDVIRLGCCVTMARQQEI
jgi:hypothetical protein